MGLKILIYGGMIILMVIGLLTLIYFNYGSEINMNLIANQIGGVLSHAEIDSTFPHLSQNTTGQKWTVLKSTGEESGLQFWTANSKDKKTELGWIPLNNDCTGWDDMNLFDKNHNEILDDKSKAIKLKCESSKCDGQNCYHISLTDAQAINIDDYVQLGNNSVVTEYQDQNMLSGDTGFSTFNITIYKNISGNYTNQVNDIWVTYYDDRDKFGANDSSNQGVEHYKYRIESDHPITENNWKPYLQSPNKIHKELIDYYEGHTFDFFDICSRNFECWEDDCNYSANCEFDYYNNSDTYFLDVSFYSDWFIDPTYEITDVSATADLDNVVCEGSGWFCHLNISDENLILYMPFDVENDSTTVYNWNGAGDGTIADVNAVSWDSNGKYGGAYNFDGTSSTGHINVGSPAALDNLVNFTYMAWIKPELGGADTRAIMAKRSETKKAFTFQKISSTFNLEGDIDLSGTNAYSMATGFAYETWIHVAMVFDNSTKNIRLYVNGTEVTYDTQTTGTGSVVDDSAETFFIGDTQFVREFNGTIDEVMVFNRNLSAEEISQIYNATYERFYNEGTHELNQSITAGKNTLNVTIHHLNQNLSNLSLKIHDNVGSWSAEQNMTDNYPAEFTIDTSSSMVNLTFKYITESGNNSWSPILLKNITIETFDKGEVEDTTPPTITIDSPTNITYSFSLIDLNVSADETIDTWWYSNDSDLTNHSFSPNLSAIWDEGSNNVTVYANDSSSNVGGLSIIFVVDTIFPVPTITFPSNNTNHSDNTLDVNYTYVESNCDSVWFTNNTGLTNITLTNCGDNITSETWLEGINNITLYINDTAGNENSTNVRFYIDTTFPLISIQSPSNNTNTTDTTLEINYTYTETNPDTCRWTNNSGASYHTITCGTNITGITWLEGINNITIEINDTVGNSNSTSLTFVLDTLPPYFDDYPFTNISQDNLTAIEITFNATDLGVGVDSFNVSDSTNFTINSTGGLTNNTVLAVGYYELIIGVNDTLDNTNTTIFGVNITEQPDSINPLISMLFPSNNTNHSYNTLEINYTYTETNPDTCWWTNNTGITNHTLTSCGTNITGITWLEGENNLTIYINDTSNNLNSTSVTFFVDTTPPICTLISRTPLDIEANSTGTFEVIINCTDPNEINISSMLFTKTVEDEGDFSPPFNWSYRPPSNNKGVEDGIFTEEAILLADGRGDNKWYDFYKVNGVDLFSDNHSYAVNGYDSERITITNGTYENGFWAILNYSFKVEPSAFENMVFLSRGKMESEVKKNYSIHNNNPLLVKFWNFNYGKGNYTTTTFLDVDYTGNPNKDLNVYFCNSSYDTTGSTSPLTDVDNCVYVDKITEARIDVGYDYESKNSSYLKSTFGITNNFLGGIYATKYIYIFYQSDTSTPDKAFYIKYTNESSGTNVSFKDSKVAWTSTNEGGTWTQAEFTPDVWISQVEEGGHFLGGIYLEDTLGNNYTNFSFIHDGIGDVAWEITYPTIRSYNSSAYQNDLDLNKTHKDTMQIHIGVAIDPDETQVGNVTHNLTLRNTDGTWNYTINTSFKSSDDSDIYVNFDTNLVADGLYRMNITAYSGDDETDIKSHLSEENFTIDNTKPIPTIAYPTNTTYSSVASDLNFTYTETSPDQCWYAINNGANSTTQVCTSNFSSVTYLEGSNFIELFINDSVGNENSTSVTFILDTLPPYFDEIPTDISQQNTTLISLDVNATDVSTGIDSYFIDDETNFTIDSGTGLLTNNTVLAVHNYTINISVNDTFNHINSTIWRVNISAAPVVDTTPPIITLQNFTITVNNSFSQTITVTDNVGVDHYALNDTSVFNISQVGLITNVTALNTINFYTLNISVNDTSNNNATGTFWINVTPIVFVPYAQVWRNDTTLTNVAWIDKVGDMFLSALNVTKIFVRNAVGFENYGVCYMITGELGHCTDAINSTGACTCVANM